MDKLDKLDKLTHACARDNVQFVKNKIKERGLDYATYVNLNPKFKSYYLNGLKLETIQELEEYYLSIEDDDLKDKTFFYTLDKILTSSFKPDCFIAYFKSVYENNYNRYVNRSDIKEKIHDDQKN